MIWRVLHLSIDKYLIINFAPYKVNSPYLRNQWTTKICLKRYRDSKIFKYYYISIKLYFVNVRVSCFFRYRKYDISIVA